MPNEIRADFNLRGEKQAEAGFKAVGKAAGGAGDELEEMSVAAIAAGKATDDAGDEMREAARDADFLNRRIEELSGSYRGLLVQLNATGDTSLLKGVNAEKRQLNRFKALAKDFAPSPAEVVEVGKPLGQQLMTAVTAGARAGGPALTGVLVAAAITAAPGIAATLSGAVLGGVGLGGIVGGVALAAQDARVQATAKEVGQTLSDELQDSASGFIEPVIRSLQKVGGAGLGDKLAPTFDALATKVDPLTDGLLGLVDQAIPGLERLAEAAGPSLDVLAEGLPQIGAAVSDFFFSISDDPESAADALELFIDAVTTGIRVGGDFIETLVGIYSGAYDVAEALGIVSEEELFLQRSTKDTSGEVKNLVEHTEDAEKAMQAFESAIQSVFGRTLSVREATLEYEQSIDDLVEELTKGERSLKDNTQAGRDNWAAINDVAKAIEGQREANVANGMSMDAAGAKYDAQLEDLRKTLLHLGYNKKAVNDYIDELKGVPKQALTEIHLKGIKAALADIKELSTALGAVAGYGIQAAISGPGRRAAGGPVSAGKSYIVGETGPELLQMGAGTGHVYNADQTASMLSGASGGASGGVVRLEVVHRWEGPPGAAGDLGEALAKFIRTDVKVRGGGSVVAAYDER